ncbi:DNA-binding FrmR family transcriptional regulator [Paraburkholderia unamae]|nr:DNA-binding FrmR family transcriptional regulator [Paraburkholderia unamae]
MKRVNPVALRTRCACRARRSLRSGAIERLGDIIFNGANLYSLPVLTYTANQYPEIDPVMPHSPEEKKRVLTRVRKVRGQLDALERALVEGAECAPVLQQLAAIRGAINGVMAGVLESHLREEFSHLADSEQTPPGSIDDVVTLIRTYLR